MGGDSRKNKEQGRQICADGPLQSDVVRLLILASHRTFIKKTKKKPKAIQLRLQLRLVNEGKSTCLQLDVHASEPSKHNREQTVVK